MGRLGHLATVYRRTADLRTKILDLRGFYSSKILIIMGGIPRPMEFPGNYESGCWHVKWPEGVERGGLLPIRITRFHCT